MTSRIEAQPIPPLETVPKKKISTVGGFIAGGIAACGAVTVTNPIELVKTRSVI
jgi:solute carrier family 25 protein 34/35